MKIPVGFKKFYPKQNSWLQIKKPIYGLKQSGLYYYGIHDSFMHGKKKA